MRANKLLVKQAVEKAFDVSVVDVNILVMPAKTTGAAAAFAFAIPSGRRPSSLWRPATAFSCLKACNREDMNHGD